MKFLKTVAVSVVLASSFAASAFASVTQSTAPASSDQYASSNAGYHELSRITFAAGTNTVLSLTSSVTLKDQGGGGQDPSNGVYVGLYNGETDLYNLHLAGATHTWTTQTQDFDALDLENLNAFLAGIDQSTNPLISMRMFANAWGYPAWALHTSNATMTITSGQVPEPTSIALFGLALAGLAVARRKSVK
jgi:FlaG/FlaF family flagellin (archaellin)